MNSRLQQILIVTLFALFFMTAGWVAPALYASHAPAHSFIESNSYQANNVSTSANVHVACFDRSVNTATTGTVYTELYLVSVEDETNRIEVESRSKDRYFEEGNAIIHVETDLPDTIERGEYYYERTYEMQLADGRITRIFTFESNTFHVTNMTEPAPC